MKGIEKAITTANISDKLDLTVQLTMQAGSSDCGSSGSRQSEVGIRKRVRNPAAGDVLPNKLIVHSEPEQVDYCKPAAANAAADLSEPFLTDGAGGKDRKDNNNNNNNNPWHLCFWNNCQHDLLTYEEVPDYQQRKHILSGYRPTLDVWPALKTIFSIHNETGNIWTHLPGVLFVAYTGFSWHIEHAVSSDWLSYLFMTSMFISLFMVYFASTVFHTLVCGDRKCAGVCLAVDMSGILLHITFAFFCGIYVGFWCKPGLRAFYLLWTCGVFLLMVVPQIIDGGSASFISKVCATIGVSSGIIPAIHAVFAISAHESELFIFPIFAMFVFYFIGALFYFYHIPEIWHPGRFDYFVHSHQLWHVFVLLAGCTYMLGVVNLYAYQVKTPCAARENLPGMILERPTGDFYFFGIGI